MARPEVNVDIEKLKVLMRYKPTLSDCAAFFQCSEDTIARRIADTFECSFAEFRDQNMVHTRFTLIQTAIKKAEKGDNVMLIFCLKNLCGWRDKQAGEDGPPININNFSNKTDEELDARMQELLSKNKPPEVPK